MLKNKRGITLVALIVTIIVLLILASVSITMLTSNGILGRAKQAREETMKQVAREEVQLAINILMTNINNKAAKIGSADKNIVIVGNNYNNITLKMISDEVNRINKRNTYVDERMPTYIIYPEQETRIGEKICVNITKNLGISGVKTFTEIINDPESGFIKEPIITVDEIKDTSFRVNIENPNSMLEGVTYDYYINDEKKIENTTSLSETINGLEETTTYNVKVILKYNNSNIESNELSIETKETSITAPTISTSGLTSSSFKVNISDSNSNLEGVTYDYYLNNQVKVANSTALSQVISGLNGSTTYTVKVVLKYKNRSINSNELKVTTSAAPIVMLDYAIIRSNGIFNATQNGKYIYKPAANKASDALGYGAFDKNTNTYANDQPYVTGNPVYEGNTVSRYIQIDSSAVGKTISINWSDGSSWGTMAMQILASNKSTVVYSKELANLEVTTTNITITSNMKWIKFTMGGCISHGRVHEITVK